MSTLIIKPTEELDWREGRGYGHTTPITTTIINGISKTIAQNQQIIARKQWSKILRDVVDFLKPYINECDREIFEKTFNYTLEKLIFDLGKEPNSNFSVHLFANDSFMNSSLYKSNDNHLLELFDGPEGSNKYICAVYIDEIVWVMKALVDTIMNMLDVYFEINIQFEDKKQRIDTLPDDDPRIIVKNLLTQITDIQTQLIDLYSKL